jgi:hypothetical protein
MNISPVKAIVGAAVVAFAALAFAGAQHTTLLASPVANVKSPSPGASAKSVQESAEPAQTPEATDTADSAGSTAAGTHPCNHGFYVSQAAHAHKGGHYVSTIAQSDLGKNGDCSAPLPAPAP